MGYRQCGLTSVLLFGSPSPACLTPDVGHTEISESFLVVIYRYYMVSRAKRQKTSASGLRSHLHCSGSCGQAAQILTKSSYWWRSSTRENQTNEPRAVRRTSLRAASRAHEVLCTPNSTVGFAHITAANEK